MTTVFTKGTVTSALAGSIRFHGSPSISSPLTSISTSLHGSPSGSSSSTSSSSTFLKGCQCSFVWGKTSSSSNSCCVSGPISASDFTTGCPTSTITNTALREQVELRSSSMAAEANAATSFSPGTLLCRVADDNNVVAASAAAAEEGPSSSSSSSSSPTSTDVKSWRARRATTKTTRRRALAICLALASVSQHRPSSSSGSVEEAQSSVAHARDFISVSPSTTGVPAPDVSSATAREGYGDLVTVSTGSSGSSSDGGIVKGLPSWMRGTYHLCMGDGFHVQLPADWHMHDTQGHVYGTVLRYEDTTDPSTNVIVLKSPTSQSRTNDLGNPEDWIREQAYLLTGSNAPLHFQQGDEMTDAAKKFPSGHISIAKVLNADKPTNKQGLTYYNYEIVTKQEGKRSDGMHELVSAVVNNGNLYMCRVQTGEGRWQEDAQSMAQHIVDSFQITGFKIHV